MYCSLVFLNLRNLSKIKNRQKAIDGESLNTFIPLISHIGNPVKIFVTNSSTGGPNLRSSSNTKAF